MSSAPIQGMTATRLALAFGVSLSATACQRDAAAQVVADDPLGPMRCYQIVDAAGLNNNSALGLCSGATSAAPGECYAAADDRLPALTTQQIVRLCQNATSLAPLACYERLEAEGTLTNEQILDYCVTRCPVGPAPPQVSDPACAAAALEQTNLTQSSIGELCSFARSAGPVACYLVGNDTTALTETQLVDLCRQRFGCQYYNLYPVPESGP